jgi:hypothetical protein
MMPVMPNIKDTGNEKMISNPPRMPRGSPHPGWSRKSARIVTPLMASTTAEIIPKRIFVLAKYDE